MNNVEGYSYFSSCVYSLDKPEFLLAANLVADEFLQNNECPVDEIYPVCITGNMYSDVRLAEFCEFTAITSREILNNQGYNIDLFYLYFQAMWAQKHHKSSGMERHIHGNGCQIVGFYFLEVPENSSKVIFHDPNSAKVITGLQEKNPSNATLARGMINYSPKAGQFLFSNSWLPHSFTRNQSDQPLKFIHFNLGVQLVLEENVPNVEVI